MKSEAARGLGRTPRQPAISHFPRGMGHGRGPTMGLWPSLPQAILGLRRICLVK